MKKLSDRRLADHVLESKTCEQIAASSPVSTMVRLDKTREIF